jgi:hypothetical protein
MDAKVIDHQQAIRDLMAERYLLGELSEAERDAYEAHLFDCQTCFEQVRAGTEFVGHIKRVGAQEPVAPTGFQPAGLLARLAAGFRQPVAAFAAVLCVFAVGVNIYQYRELSRPKGAALERSYVLTGIAHGGGSAKLIEAPSGSTLSLSLEYVPRGEFTAYGVRLLSASGAVLSSLPIPGDQVDGMAKLAVPANSLSAGKYSIIVWGRNSDRVESEIARGAFELRFPE